MPDGIADIADALAGGLASRTNADDRFFADVKSVNTDGTVSLISGYGDRPSVPAMASYSPRAAGDTVLCMRTRQGPVVVGKVGGPQSGPDFTLSNSSAPGGQGWEETVSGQIWAKSDGAQWQKRTVSGPPAPGGVTQTAGSLVTYRGGVVLQSQYAEQGDYTGRGSCTGFAAFGSWAGLATHTATGGTLTAHRRAAGHGFTYGLVYGYAYACLATGVPPSPPTLIGDPTPIVLALNQTDTVGVSAAWAQPFCAGTANAIAFWSGNDHDNIEIDSVTLTVNY